MDSIQTHVEAVEGATAFLKERLASIPEIAIILGTGLDGVGEQIEVYQEIRNDDIPGFPKLTVQSHSGTLIVGKLGHVPVLALNGRAHLYEGYSAKEVTLPVRVLGALGVQTLIVSNACGGMNPAYRAGDIMLIEDHINLMGANPLEGPNHATWGPRFPDMSDPYASSLRHIAREVAQEEGIPLHEGVYVSVVGPNLETRAEYRMLSTMGADVVGMSTVPEVLVARHMDINVLGFSVITDECDPDNLASISIEDVLAAAEMAREPLARLMSRVVSRIHSS